MKQGTWGRLFTAMITPFKEDGSVNFSELERVAHYLVDIQSNDGLVVSGTTGESPTLSREEKLLVLETVLNAVGDKCTVIFGSGTNNTQESIELSKAAEKLGAHGLMLVNPAYNKPNQEGQLAHFTAIAKQTSLPIMIYNNPGRTLINLNVDTFKRLVDTCPNVVAIKDSSANVSQFTGLVRELSDRVLIYSGDDAYTLPMLSVGGYGIVSVAAHLVGKSMKQMVDCFYEDPIKAAQINAQLHPVFQSIFSAPSPAPVKYALSKTHGFDCERLRLPMLSLNSAEKAVVDKGLQEANSYVDRVTAVSL
jgi:4-hydroxy-tetrahydrodipicolinate synthase